MRLALTPPPGLISDDTSFASPGVWEDGSNVRFWQGKPEVIGPWTAAFGTTLSGVCRNLLAWTDNDGEPNIAFGTNSALQIYNGGTLHTITPAILSPGQVSTSGGAPGFGSGTYSSGTFSTPATDYYARTWSLATWGERLVASPRGGTLYQWANNPAVPATPAANAPVQISVMLVTPERQILALGCNEEFGGDFNPLCIRGCDLEDLTSWTTTPSNNAFEHILEGGGRIVGAALISSYVVVWTDNGLHLGQFVGAPEQTYRFDRVSENCGLIGANAFCIVDQTAYWIAPDYQFRVWQVGGQPTILKCPIWKDFADNLDTSQREKIVGAGVSKFGEAWFHYPDLRDGDENSRYVAFSTIEGTWFKGVLARAAAADAGVATHPILVSPSGTAFYHEHAGGTAPAWHIKTSDQYLDDAGQEMMIRGVTPDFENQGGDIALTLFIRGYPQGAAASKGPYTLTTSTRKKDFRVTGKIIAAQFSGSAYARTGKPVFDIVPAGRR